MWQAIRASPAAQAIVDSTWRMNFIETEIYSHLALVAHKYEYMSVNTHETTEHAPVCSGMLGMGSAEHTPVLDMRRAKYALVLGC